MKKLKEDVAKGKAVRKEVKKAVNSVSKKVKNSHHVFLIPINGQKIWIKLILD